MALGHQCKEVREGRSSSESNNKSKDIVSDNDIDITLYETERLRQLLVQRLDETGWRRKLRVRVQNIVNDLPFKKLTIADIVQELAPKASSTISEDIKKELLMEAEKSLKTSN